MRRPILIINFAAVVILTVILGLGGCGKRELPGGIISIYNSEMQKTSRFTPMETMYVELNGLAADKTYKVEVLDPDGVTISELSAATDGNGKIAATPLWYEVGLRKADATHATPWVGTANDIEVRSFYVRVSSSDGKTDYRQPFFIFYNTAIGETPRTIAYASDKDGNISNTFEEAGSREYSPLTQAVTASEKTKVYLTLDRIDPLVTTTVDVYIIPFNGNRLYNNNQTISGDVIPANPSDYIKVTLDTATQFSAVPGTTALTSNSPVWDINTTNAPGSGARLTNPTDRNTAYSMVVVTNPTRTTLKLSDIVNNKNVSVTDAIDGNNVPGFIVLNTPANDVKYSITDNLGNKTGVLTEAAGSPVDANRYLLLNVDNVPATPGSLARVYVVPAGAAPADGAALPADVRGGFTNALVAPPSSGDLHLLPYISNATLLATSNSSASLLPYRYTADIAADTDFDVIVKFDGAATFTLGSDVYIPKAATVKSFMGNNAVKTFSATAPTAETSYFDETGTLGGKTSVYVKMTVPPATAVRTYLFKGGANLATASPILTKSLDYSTAINNTALFWDLNNDPFKVINPVADPTAGNYNAYDIVLDTNNSGGADAGDMKVSVVINDTTANTYPRVTYANIASSGIYTYLSTGTDFGYIDLFNSYGSNTLSNHYVSAGIKAIWNPYIGYYSGPRPSLNLSAYVGNMVDVYIVDAATFNLKNWQNRRLTNADDVTNNRKVIPVQYGCQNGAGQNNIWPARPNKPMIAGKYYVIVDVNRDGMITEGLDVIDAVDQTGKSIIDDPSIVGFTVN